MSRREEVKAEIGEWASDGDGAVQMACLRNRCRTLADEVDARDAIIDKLLAMLEPKKPRPKHEDFVPFNYDKWNTAVCDWDNITAAHARACEIAGRVK